MIKTDKDIFYIAAGEACYIARSAAGRLCSMWFGARVEPEDDLSALGLYGSDELYLDSGGSEPERNVVTDAVSGARVEVELKIKDSCVLDTKPAPNGLPALAGGKTLCVTLADGAAGLEARLYYTPYPRGGFSRRTEIKNTGKRTLNLRAGSSVWLSGGTAERGAANSLFVADGEGGTYAFTAVYGGAVRLEASDDAGATEVVFAAEESATLKPGGTLCSPELLCVWSDNGADGASRIIHDILREACGLIGRAPVTLAAAYINKENAVSAADCAAELGADALIAPFDGSERSALAAAASQCKDNGIRFGLRFGTELQSCAAFKKPGLLTKDGKGHSYAELSDPKAVEAAFAMISDAVKSFDTEYVVISDLSRPNADMRYMIGLYALLARLRAAFPELYIEGAPDCGCLCYCQALTGSLGTDGMAALPPRALVFRVTNGKGSLKTKFDFASLGILGYDADIAALSDDIKRAIRAQILSYQDDAYTVADGDMYAARGARNCFIAVAKDKSRAFAVCRRDTRSDVRVRLVGLDSHGLYRVRELDGIFSGAALAGAGIIIPKADDPGTYTFHLRQVADYE